MTITRGTGTTAALAALAQRLGKGHVLKVGFFENADYPDGTKVATVAAIQNFGAPAASIPKRPFFTNMIRDRSPRWGQSIANLMALHDNDVEKVLGLMGEGIAGQLQQSIRDMNAPPLSQITLMLRKMRSEDQSLVVTASTVGEAARRLKAGEAIGAVNTKPLNDTAHMQNSVGYQVGDNDIKHL